MLPSRPLCLDFAPLGFRRWAMIRFALLFSPLGCERFGSSPNTALLPTVDWTPFITGFAAVQSVMPRLPHPSSVSLCSRPGFFPLISFQVHLAAPRMQMARGVGTDARLVTHACFICCASPFVHVCPDDAVNPFACLLSSDPRAPPRSSLAVYLTVCQTCLMSCALGEQRPRRADDELAVVVHVPGGGA